MQYHVLHAELLEVLRLSEPRNRDFFFGWCELNRVAGMRPTTYADIAAGRPASGTALTKVLRYVLDIDGANNAQAIRLHAFVAERGMSACERTPIHILTRFATATESPDLMSSGLESVMRFFGSTRLTVQHVRPCREGSELRTVVNWLFIEGGRRFGGKRLSEGDAIRCAEKHINTTMPEYLKRLASWQQSVPWSVAVGGDSDDHPCAVSIAAPISSSQLEQARAGRLDMLRAELDKDLQHSSRIFVETLGVQPKSHRRLSLTPSLVHLFRTTLCQQAVLSDVSGLGYDCPLSILSFGCTPEFEKWLKAFKYKPIEKRSPITHLPLWEKEVWIKDTRSCSEAAHLGVWNAIQHQFRQSSLAA